MDPLLLIMADADRPDVPLCLSKSAGFGCGQPQFSPVVRTKDLSYRRVLLQFDLALAC